MALRPAEARPSKKRMPRPVQALKAILHSHELRYAITVSSGNVFADLGLPHPEERLFKAQFAAQIPITLQHQGLTQSQAAERTGLSETQFADLLRGCLGHRIAVRLSPEETDPADARPLLIAA